MKTYTYIQEKDGGVAKFTLLSNAQACAQVVAYKEARALRAPGGTIL
jgi:hypothetical protein